MIDHSTVPKFTSLGQYNIPGRGLVFAVDPGPYRNFLAPGQTVEIDGKTYRCQSVECGGSTTPVGLVVKEL